MSSNRGHRAGQCAPEVPRTRIRARGDLQERRTRPGDKSHPAPNTCVPGQGAAAESHREYVAGRGAVAESLCGRGCSPAEAVAAAAWKRLPLRGSRCGTNGRACCCHCEARRGTIGKHMRAGRSNASREKQCWQGGAVLATYR